VAGAATTGRHRWRDVVTRVGAGAAILAAGLAMSVAAAPGVIGTNPAGASSPVPVIRVGSFTNHKLLTFPLPSSGNVKPIKHLTPTPPQGLTGFAYDSHGDLWSTETSAGGIVEFTATQLSAGGVQKPAVSIPASTPISLAFDSSGDLWVGEFGASALYEYTPSQLAHGGTVTPVVRISSDGTTPASLDEPAGLAFDASGDLWVSNNAGSLVEFARTQLGASGSPKPKVLLAGATTGLELPRWIAFDAKGNLWVASRAGSPVSEFASGALGASGDPAPAAKLNYSTASSWQLVFDAAGNLWVTYSTDSVGEWTPSQQANSANAPAKVLSGATTGLEDPSGLALTVPPAVISLTPVTGVAGSSVTVHGTGFTVGTTVNFGPSAATTVHVVSPFTLTAKVPPGAGRVTVTVTNWLGTSATSPADQFLYHLGGYDLAGSDGGVFVFPTGQPGGYYGSLPGLGVTPVAPIVGLVPTLTDQGYFLVGTDGGVFSFGTAPFLGSLPGKGVKPVAPITGIVAADTDKGYFLVGKDGGVFAFGTVPFLGSLPGKGISTNNVIGIAATPSGGAYWVVTATGTVYGFGTAKALGTAKGTSSPVSAIAGTPTGGGYWITTQNGTVYPFGNAKSFGTLPALHVTPALAVIGIVHTNGTGGYWLIGQDGGIFAFGNAGFVGSLPGLNVHVANIVGAVPN
jgi:IPT/TIG domain